MSVESFAFADFIAGDDNDATDNNINDIGSETSSELRGRKRRQSIESHDSFADARRQRRRRETSEDVDAKKTDVLMRLDMKREMCRDIAIKQFNMGDSLDAIQTELDRVERVDSIKRAMGFIKLMTTKSVNGSEFFLVNLLNKTYMRGWGITWGAQVASGAHDSVIMRVAIQYHRFFKDIPPWMELSAAILVSGYEYAEVQAALAAMNEGTTDEVAKDVPIPRASGEMNGPSEIERDLREEAEALETESLRPPPIPSMQQPAKRTKKKHRNDAAVIDLF